MLWYLLRTWCCQCLLHLVYVLAIRVCCGVWSAPGAVYVSAICIWGAWRAPDYRRRVALVIFQTFPLWSYGTYMYFAGHVRIDLRQS